MPVTLEFGLDILSGTYKKDAKLINTPGIVGTSESFSSCSISYQLLTKAS
jgi:hypothetical protein